MMDINMGETMVYSSPYKFGYSAPITMVKYIHLQVVCECIYNPYISGDIPSIPGA